MRFEQIMSNEVLDIRDGTHESPKYKDIGYPLITSKNLKHGRIDFSDVNFISEEDYISINKRSKVNKGDVLYSMIGSIGNYAFVDNEPNYAIKNVALFRFIDKRLHNKFFLHLINSSIFQRQIEQRMKGGTQKFVSLKILRNLKIPLPPLEEQKKIAAILDAADEYRKKTKALIDKYDQLTQSLFLDIFGDPFKGEVSPLKNNITVLGGYAFKSKDFIQVGLPLIKIGTVNKGYFEIDNFSFLPESYLSNYSKWNVRPGDILMSLTGTVGKDDYGNVEKATDHYENYLLNQRVAKLEPSNGIYLKEFLFGMFRNNKTKKELTKISRGVRQANISNRDIENLEMITPCIEDQKLYVSAVSEIEKQKQQAEASLVKAEELFNSLLQKAFKGELTN